jgi:hypothetical protein
MRAVAIVAAFVFGISAAKAQNGDVLSEQCRENRTLVVGYVAGFLDKAAIDSDVLFHFYFDTYGGVKTAATIEKDNGALVVASTAINGYCIPDGTTVSEEAHVFCEYLLNNPNQRKDDAAELLSWRQKLRGPAGRKQRAIWAQSLVTSRNPQSHFADGDERPARARPVSQTCNDYRRRAICQK